MQNVNLHCHQIHQLKRTIMMEFKVSLDSLDLISVFTIFPRLKHFSNVTLENRVDKHKSTTSIMSC